MNLSIPDLCTYTDPANLGFTRPEGQFWSSQLTKVAASQRQSADITIMTAEGDKVTLSTTSELQADYLTYNSLGRTASSLFGIQAETFSLEDSRELQIQVEGNLSRRELRDIRKTMKVLDKIMKDVVSGNMDHALERALKIEPLGSISSLEAYMEYEKTLSTEHTVTQEFTSAVPEEGKEETRTFDSAERIADHMMDVVRHSGVKKGKLLKPVREMFSSFFKEHARPEHHKPSDLDAARRVESALMKKMKAFRGMSKPEWKEHQNPPAAEIPDVEIRS